MFQGQEKLFQGQESVLPLDLYEIRNGCHGNMHGPLEDLHRTECIFLL